MKNLNRIILYISVSTSYQMAYIKKLVVHGFKSFAKKTEIPFDKGINVIIGPNGSGKSNISDAMCFVLGRLSVKSLRAEKSKNLILILIVKSMLKKFEKLLVQ